MRAYLFILPLLFFVPFSSSCQRETSTLTAKLLAADSVYLLSHKETKEFAVRKEPLPRTEGFQQPEPPVFLLQGSINPAIVTEKAVLNKEERVRLVKILERPVRQIKYTPATCFTPLHSIVIVSSGRTSFMDFSFMCTGLVTSKDIQLTMLNFDQAKWTALINFFKGKGVIYGLDKEGASLNQ